jgi:head-tail adaptor
MSEIGGNTTATIQISTTSRNAIGEQVKSWQNVQTLHGWLDLSSGDSRYSTYNAKIQESSHVFVSDYVPLDSRIEAENARLVHDGKVYDIMLIDDPMNLHQQWEIYLKYTGGQ